MSISLEILLVDFPHSLIQKIANELEWSPLQPQFTFTNSEGITSSDQWKTTDAILWYKNDLESFESVVVELRKVVSELPIILYTERTSTATAIAYLNTGIRDIIVAEELHSLPIRVYENIRTEKEPDSKANQPEPSYAQSLVENVLDIITVLDIKGTILYESPSVYRVLGYTTEELIGRNAFSMIHPFDVPKVMPVFMLALATPGVPHSTQFRFKHIDGSWRQLEAVGKSLYEQGQPVRILVTSRDITDKSRTEAALGESEFRFRTVVEGLGEGLLISDNDGKILYVNRRLAQMTGYDSQEMLGKLAQDLILPKAVRKDAQEWRKERKKDASHQSFNYEAEIMRADGSLFWTQINTTPYITSEGVRVGTLAAFTDITGRKQAEAELQRAYEDLEQRVEQRTAELRRVNSQLIIENDQRRKSEEALRQSEEALREAKEMLEKRVEERTQSLREANQRLQAEIKERQQTEIMLRAAKEKAEEMNRLKSAFLANMSHEIRTPMTSILGFASILSESLQENGLLEFAKMIEKSGTRLMDTINGLLDLAKIEANKLEINYTQCELNNTLKQITGTLAPLAFTKRLDYIVQLADEEIVANIDTYYFERILINIIGNAIKFTERGFVKIELYQVAGREESFHIRITDTGIGISPGFLPHIFDEFKQESSGWTRNYEGTGLGLTLSKRFIELMGGTVTVQSIHGVGSSFTLTFPMHPNSPIAVVETSQEPEEESNEPLPIPTQPIQTLVVEDNEETVTLFSTVLRKYCEVRSTSDIYEALELLQAKHFDVAIIDINLGSNKNGLDLTSIIRTTPGLTQLPIIAVTAYAMQGDREKALAAGCTEYLPKPFRKRDLIKLLLKHAAHVI